MYIMSKIKISGKKLAIQLGRSTTQILLVSGAEILHGITLETPAGAVEDGMIRNQDAVREMLKTALKAPEFKGVRNAVFTLCTSQVITETVTTPDLPTAKLDKLLQANVDMYFPVDVHDYQLAWQVIGPKPSDSGLKELLVQLWAIPVSMISRYYYVANSVGLSVAAIDYLGNSIATAVGASFSRPGKAAKARKKLDLNKEISFGKKKQEEAAPDAREEAPAGAVDTQLHLLLENDILGMTFVQNDQVVLQRFIRCGSDPAYQFGELAMMLEYFRNMDIGQGSEVEGIAAGALAEDSGVIRELEDMMGIPLRRFPASYPLQWFLCMGAANTAKDFGSPNLNKPGTVRRQFQSELWQYGLMLAGGLAVIAVFMTLLSSRLNWNADISVLQNEQNILTMQNAKISGYADNYYEYDSMYKNYDADWDTVFNSLYTHNDNLVLVLEELEDMMPKTTSVTQMQIMANGLNISFASKDKEEAAYMIMKLREMGYADLMAVSNLAGGGSGAATSYGNGDKKEAAPAEGSSTTEVNKEELFNMAMGLDSEQFQLLWDTYGKHPESTDASNTFPAIKGSVTKDQRDAALEALLNTNPFAINWFKELLMEDFGAGSESILYPHIVVDLLKMGILTNGLPKDFEGAKALLDKLVVTLTDDTNPQKLEATEALFCTHRDMELAYVYHVKLAAGLRSDAGDLYYLDLDKLTSDIRNGGSKTGDPELDAMLAKLFPYLEELDPTEPTEPDPDDALVDTIGGSLKTYLSAYTTGDAHVNSLVEGYLSQGTSGNTKLDAKLDEDVTAGKVDEELKTLLKLYRGGEKTNNTVIDTMLSKFLVNMEVKRDALKNRLIVCLMDIGGEPVDPTDPSAPTAPAEPVVPTVPTTPNETLDPNEMIAAMMGEYFQAYLNDGTTGIPDVDAMIEDFLTTGTTGDKALDRKIVELVVDGGVEIDYSKLGKFYLNAYADGKMDLDNEAVKNIISTILRGEGITREALVEAYIQNYEKIWNEAFGNLPGDSDSTDPTEAPIPSNVDILKMGEYFVQFINEGTSGIPEADAMIEKFLTTGTTGNAAADMVILDYILNGNPDLDYNKLAEYYEKAIAEGKISLTNLNSEFMLAILKAIMINGGVTEDALKDIYLDMYEKLFGESFPTEGNPNATEPTETEPEEEPDLATLTDLYGVFFRQFLLAETTAGLINDATIEELTGQKLTEAACLIIDEDCRSYIYGSIQDAEKAAAITSYIASGQVDDVLKARLTAYRQQKNLAEDQAINFLFATFLSTCDYPYNNVLEVRMTLMLTQLANEANQSASQKATTAQDTRIHFTVLLNYSDALRQEELNRKGLEYDDKLERMEVAE